MNTKLIILALGFIFIYSCAAPQQENNTLHTVYLVRHAEKADDGTKDPPLTEEGRQRAEKIAFMLTDAGITNVYSTDYNRTKDTAKPLAEQLGLEVEIYNPNESEDFVKKILSQKGNVLIVGHSNTTPTMTNALSGAEQYQSIDESDYTNFFIVTISGAKVSTQRLHF